MLQQTTKMFSQGLSFHDGDDLVLHCNQSLTLLLKLSVPCGIAVFSQTVSGSHYLPDHSSGSVRGILSRDRIYEYVAHKLSLSIFPILESCHNCDMEMFPTHLCQDDQDSAEEEVQAMSTLEYQTKMVMLMRDLQSVKV